ncbi:hypothetical protein DDQ41_04735 [Streptomyces spongiicola]|uniref:Uncharacterized protein n=1 Tax=Streptomyces spongiicola TaxID=1690221 RepID=A0ABN5KEY6_9ACTN|nr:hypothetical protein DDQ41_04735 [Streptomyces spongiicola]
MLDSTPDDPLPEGGSLLESGLEPRDQQAEDQVRPPRPRARRTGTPALNAATTARPTYPAHHLPGPRPDRG